MVEKVLLEMEIQEDVVIVGAGIAGLATALALKKVGVRSLVLERSHELRTNKAALVFPANAWVALEALGISSKLTPLYPPIQKGYVTNVENGAVQEFSYAGPDGSGRRLRTIHRGILLETLAQELPTDAIRFSSRLKSIDNITVEGSSIAVLSLEDGTVIKAKIVIGCDGVNSVVARWLGLKAPVHSGRVAVRGISVYPEGHGLKNEYQQFVGCGRRVGFAPLNDKELKWFVIYESASNNDGQHRKKSQELIQKLLQQKLADFPPIVLDMVQKSDLQSQSWSPLLYRVPWDLLLSDMYKENITVAGDAMHPMTPDLAQGGCSSLEDAVVLGRHIGNSCLRNGKISTEALKGYVKERRLRVAGLIFASNFAGWIADREFGRFTKLILLKIFSLLNANSIYYNCGQLPAHEESMRKKSE